MTQATRPKRVPCPACPEDIPAEGIGRLSHLRKHVRAGRLVEIGVPGDGVRHVTPDDEIGLAVARMEARLATAALRVQVFA